MDYDVLAGELVRTVSRLNRTEAYRRLNEFYKGEMFVLRYLDGGSALPGVLREAMGVSSARVAAALGVLERKGFVTRNVDETDRRRVIVSITEAGRRHLQVRQRALKADVEHVLSELGEEDTREYIRIVGRIMEISGLTKSERMVRKPSAERNEETT